MSIKAISNYPTEHKDRVENFNGMQVVYLLWSQHLMFASPLAVMAAPDMPLTSFFSDVVTPAYASHPDSAKVDLTKVEWQLNGQPFTPNLQASLIDNGIDHKSLLTMTTPGLTGIQGSAS